LRQILPAIIAFTSSISLSVLTGTVLEKPNRKWRFVERNENTFHWQNITIQENGDIIFHGKTQICKFTLACIYHIIAMGL